METAHHGIGTDTLRALLAGAATLLLGCASLPQQPVERALYEDLRTLVEVAEDDGWIIDSLRLQANAEPALHSVCQVEPGRRASLEAWIGERLVHGQAPGGESPAALRSLQRTRALLRYADARAAQDCPDWLPADPRFAGVQGHDGRWVVLADTHGFMTFVIDTRAPALGAGGRALLGYGLGSRYTLAAGAELAASGTFIPTGSGGQGFDATFTIATPLLLRWTQLSRLLDVEFAPVVRFEHGSPAFPPGARIELGAGTKSARHGSLASYFMLYLGYEYHPALKTSPDDHTLQAGTRISWDWTP